MKQPKVNKEKGMTAKKLDAKAKPKATIRFAKCIHFFKCMFNDDCESVAKAELWKMSPEELEAHGRMHGVELDRRKTKAALVDELYEAW